MPKSWPFELLDTLDDVEETEFAVMFGELRGLLNTVASTHPSRELVRDLTEQFREARTQLTPFRTEDHHAPYGQLNVVGDQGLAALPLMWIERAALGSIDATVTFSRWHVGGGGSVHGGQVATALDSLMGRSQLVGGWIARTAYLNVSYHDGTPFDRPVKASVRTTSSDGRKVFLHARLYDGAATFAEADALFVRVSRYPGATDELTPSLASSEDP